MSMLRFTPCVASCMTLWPPSGLSIIPWLAILKALLGCWFRASLFDLLALFSNLLLKNFFCFRPRFVDFFEPQWRLIMLGVLMSLSEDLRRRPQTWPMSNRYSFRKVTEQVFGIQCTMFEFGSLSSARDSPIPCKYGRLLPKGSLKVLDFSANILKRRQHQFGKVKTFMNGFGRWVTTLASCISATTVQPPPNVQINHYNRLKASLTLTFHASHLMGSTKAHFHSNDLAPVMG